nr:hypothetical protein [Eubacterium sp.]
MKEDRANSKKVVVNCPVCGFTDEVDDFSKDDELCAHCGKSTYTFRTVNSIRKVFVGELNKKSE